MLTILRKESTRFREDQLVDHDLVGQWESLTNKPKVIVFDLDHTLWPYDVDDNVKPPIEKRVNSLGLYDIYDNSGKKFSSYEHVTRILHTLKNHCLNSNGGHLAIASRSTTPDLAMQSIEAYGWKSYLSSFQIYNTNKVKHMRAIKEELGAFEFNVFLFFDDVLDNIASTSRLGLQAFLVSRQDGLDKSALLKGLKLFDKMHS